MIDCGSAGWMILNLHASWFPQSGCPYQTPSAAVRGVEINSSFHRPRGPITYEQRAADVHAVAAPSTGSAAPETNEASSEIRNSAALAISSGLPVRPIGFCRPRSWTSSSLSWPAARCWSGRATNTRSIGVSIGPGQIALTRILSGARRLASERTKPTTPNLAIEYTGLLGEPTRPEVE